MRQIIHFDDVGAMGSYETPYSAGIINANRLIWSKSFNARFVHNTIFPMVKDRAFNVQADFSASNAINMQYARIKTDGSSNTFGTALLLQHGTKIYAGEYSHTGAPGIGTLHEIESLTYPAYRFEVENFGGIKIINWDHEEPRQWGSSESYAAINSLLQNLQNWSETASVTCRFIKPYKNYLIAGGIMKGLNRYPNRIQWSHPSVFGDVPSTWDYGDPTKDAGQYDILETQDDVVTCLPMGERNIIYKDNSVWSMEFIGHPSIFKFSKIFSNRGILDSFCVTSLPDGRHIVMEFGDIYVHDGQTATSVFPESLRDSIFRDIEKYSILPGNDQYRKYKILVVERLKEVWIGMHSSIDYTRMDTIWIWNYKYNTFYTRKPDNVNTQTGYYDLMVFDVYRPAAGWTAHINTGGIVRKSEVIALPHTATPRVPYHLEWSVSTQSSYVVRHSLPLGRQTEKGEIKTDQKSIKTIYSIYPHIVSETTSTFTFSISLLLKNSFTDKETTKTYEWKSTQEKLDMRESARIFGIKFQWPERAVSKKVGLSGFSIDMEIEGDR